MEAKNHFTFTLNVRLFWPEVNYSTAVHNNPDKMVPDTDWER